MEQPNHNTQSVARNVAVRFAPRCATSRPRRDAALRLLGMFVASLTGARWATVFGVRKILRGHGFVSGKLMRVAEMYVVRRRRRVVLVFLCFVVLVARFPVPGALLVVASWVLVVSLLWFVVAAVVFGRKKARLGAE